MRETNSLNILIESESSFRSFGESVLKTDMWKKLQQYWTIRRDNHHWLSDLVAITIVPRVHSRNTLNHMAPGITHLYSRFTRLYEARKGAMRDGQLKQQAPKSAHGDGAMSRSKSGSLLPLPTRIKSSPSLIATAINHCKAAQDLLSQTILEHSSRINVAVPMTTAKPRSGCREGAGCRSAQQECVPLSPGPESTESTFSVSTHHKDSLVEFSALLTNIIKEAWDKRPLIDAGDFNAWSMEWGCRMTRQRGTALLDALATLEAALLNTGDTPTFTGALGYSVIDLTFASDTLATRITSWAVSELYTYSDHQAIVFEIAIARLPRSTTRQSCKWNARTRDTECLSVMMANAAVPSRPTEEMATRLMAAITSACDASMAKSRGRRRRCAVYWWTSEIADLRRSCLRARRLAQRAHGRPNEGTSQASYASARRLLRAAIKTSKRL
ncbi:unnamed protein product [Trichogramma brassicae]|uniref:Endonuclease/exonuclease/phosphatase domain-containing protein n=1 Tax=Trichogramma brassicae TaxID=86971 RepID=A0A6H5IBG6_9HYME|nr:unnamed protein product [Trichogramma brassicae]